PFAGLLRGRRRSCGWLHGGSRRIRHVGGSLSFIVDRKGHVAQATRTKATHPFTAEGPATTRTTLCVGHLLLLTTDRLAEEDHTTPERSLRYQAAEIAQFFLQLHGRSHGLGHGLAHQFTIPLPQSRHGRADRPWSHAKALRYEVVSSIRCWLDK